MTTAYEMLGIQPNASIEEIKTAYRKKAGKYHPDKGGNSDDFYRLKAAYEFALSQYSEENKYTEEDFFKRMFGNREGPYKR